MSSQASPIVGQRFHILGNEFEIVFVGYGNIRYSGVIGGKVNNMSLEKFKKQTASGNIIYNGVESSNELQPERLTKIESKAMNRRLYYVRKIHKRICSARSKNIVEPILIEISIELGDDKPPSFSTFARWFKAYTEENLNPLSLVPNFKDKGNKDVRFNTNIDRIISNRIKEDYLTEQCLTVAAVHNNIVGEIFEAYGNDKSILKLIPTVRTIYRRIKMLDPYVVIRKRHGMHTANRDFKGAGKSLQSVRPLEKVEIDGNLIDVLITDEETGDVLGRPYLTCLIDQYSRCIVSFVITMIPFSSATLLKGLKLAISKSCGEFGGLFETMIVDNGSDYISASVRNFCNELGIRIEHGAPRDPNSKPHIERFFGTLNKQLIHQLPGTTFSNPNEKGDYDSTKMSCITLEKLNELVSDWLEKIYHRKIHRGHGRAPEKLWNEGIKDNPVNTFTMEHLDTIAREVLTRKTSNGRITIYNLKWYSHALATIEVQLKLKNLETKVEVYVDTLDLEKIYIKNPLDERIFIRADSTIPGYTKGLSLFEHKLIREELEQKGKQDMASYGEYQLEIEHWNMWQKLVVDGKSYAKKRIARLKETKKSKDSLKKIIKENNDKNKNKKQRAHVFSEDTKKPDIEINKPLEIDDINDDEIYGYEEI